MLSQIIRNLSTNWAALLVSVFVSFLLAPFVVHKLGNTYYGIWAVIGQFTGYLYLLDFGIRESVIRYASKYREQDRSEDLATVVQVSFYIYLLIAALCIGVSGIVAYFFTSIFGLDASYRVEVGIAVLLIGGTIGQVFLFNVFNGLLMGFQRYDLFNAINIVGTIVRAGAFVAALDAGFGIVALAAIQFLIALVSGLLLALKSVQIARRNGVNISLKSPKWDSVLEIRSKLVRYSAYVFINNMGQKIVFMTDAILIGVFLPVAQVTYYAIAATLIGYLRTLLASSAQIFNPLISQLSAQNNESSVRYAFTSGTRLLLFISLPIGLAFVFLGDVFISLWMGEEYKKLSGMVLLILAVSQILSAPHQVVSSALYGLNRHKFLAQMRVLEASSNILLSIALIPHFGILGVAIGTAVPHIVLVTIFLPAYGSKQVGIRLSSYFMKGYLRPLIAAIPFAVGCVLTRMYWEVQSFVQFFFIIGTLGLIHMCVSYFIILNLAERQYFSQLIHKLLTPRREALDK